ncbi:MAG: hypothetical protein HFH62_00285 [Lachnospiraceae bacterium]|nr:hypothetical protein [Lachnospiraceae bacterium]
MSKRAVAGILLAGALLMAGARPAVAEQKVDTYGEYRAALGVQTDSYRRVFRDAYFDGKAEKADGFQTLKRERSQGSGADRAEESEGTFKDVAVKGNGTYTVSLKNADFHGNRSFRKLYVATDIPNTKEIKFSNMSVSIDGRVLRTFDKPVLDTSKMYRKNSVLLAIHPVNEEVKGAISTRSVPGNRENEIKIRFTVSGFDYDKGEKPSTPSPRPTATPEESAAPSKESRDTPVPEITQAPEESENPAESGKLPMGNQVGIVATIVAAIGGVLACLAVVTKRNR